MRNGARVACGTHDGRTEPAKLRLLSSSKCFGGYNKRFEVDSECCACPLKLSIYFPPAAEERAVPVVYYLASMTTDDETFINQAGAQRKASELGLALVCSDNSPRDIPGIQQESVFPYQNYGYANAWYLDATETKYRNWQMRSWISKELPQVLRNHFPQLDTRTASLCGFSMGGHGALSIGLECNARDAHPRYRCLSALAPVCSPSASVLGPAYFAQALGPDPAVWKRYDAISQLAAYAGPPLDVLLDVGSLDAYGSSGIVNPEAFAAAAADHPAVRVTFRRREGYDHSFAYVSSYVDEHLEWHARYLQPAAGGS